MTIILGGEWLGLCAECLQSKTFHTERERDLWQRFHPHEWSDPDALLDDVEQWLPIVGYEGMYEVSSLGRARSVERLVVYKDGRRRTFEGVVLRPHSHQGWYPKVVLQRGGRSRTAAMHVLVCTAFHGRKPSWAQCVRHLNGNPLDNRVANLRWGTMAENGLDALRHGRNQSRNKTHCKHGHEFTAENTGWRQGGRERRCLQCQRRANRESRNRARARGHDQGGAA